VPKLEVETETPAAMAKDTSSPVDTPAETPPPVFTIDQFDELIFNLSFAILQLVQDITTGDAAQLNSAVINAQQAIRDHYIAVSELQKDAVLHKSDSAATRGQSSVMRPRQIIDMERHKADADRLRLTLHEQSDTLAQAIEQRDQAMMTKTVLMKDLVHEKSQREEENAELRAYKGEVDRLNALVLQAAAVNQAAAQKVEAALKEVETANIRRTAAIQVVDKVTRERDIAYSVRDAARLDRDLVRDERDMAVRDRGILLRRLNELEEQRLEVEAQQAAVEQQRIVDEEQAGKAQARREAFRVLSSKYNEKNEKKRKGPPEDEILEITPTC